MARRALHIAKWGIGGSLVGVTVGGTTAYLRHNDWDLSSTGLVRFGRAAIAAITVVADYKWSLTGLEVGSDDYWNKKSEVHWHSARRLREMCCKNRGCFIKVGQHLGALEYLLPIEYVETMKVLHSDAPKSPLQDMYRVIEEDLGKKVDEVFSSFDPQPHGTASLAQVHRATLKDGTQVAVKVQHPKVKAHSFVDMKTMELLVNIVAWVFPEFQFLWLAEESKKNLPKELDFVNEAHNCERVSRMYSNFDFLKVPKVYWEHTTERVLTMEYCEGGQVNDSEYFHKHNISVDDVSRKLGKLYSEMIFVHGYVHCDPHPGNVLVNKSDKGTQIVLLDHGLYQTLTDEFRLDYCQLWQSLINTDMKGIKLYSKRLGTGKLFGLFACMVTARSWNAITKGIKKQAFSKEEDVEIKTNAATYLPQISEILNSVPREMLLILKTNDLLRGIETNLKTRANARSFITMSRCCVRAVARHKMKRCATWWCRTATRFREQWSLFMISMYELYLWAESSSIIRTLKNFTAKETIS